MDVSKQLRFKQDGSFHIMIVGDIHEKNMVDAGARDFQKLMNRALDELKPDFAVFMGDILSGSILDVLGQRCIANEEELRESIQRILEPFRARNVPLGAVFGNHDGENGEPKSVLFSLLKEYDGFLMTDEAGVSGCGNCNLTLKSSKSDADVLNLWFIDSGNRAPEGMGKYAFVQRDQIRWYEQTAAALREKNGGTPLPAMLFQHIPVLEEYDLLQTASPAHPYSVRGNSSKSNQWYILNKKMAKGYLGEGPCTPDYNSGQFESWKKNGDVFASFFGHDHMNDFIGKKDGIYLVQNKLAGFHMYGDGLSQGVRSVLLHENEPRAFRTRMVRYREFFGTDCESVKGEELYHDRMIINAKAGAAVLGGLSALTAAAAGGLKIHKKIVGGKHG